MVFHVNLTDVTDSTSDFEVEVCMWQSAPTTGMAEDREYLVTNRFDLKTDWPMGKFEAVLPAISKDEMFNSTA